MVVVGGGGCRGGAEDSEEVGRRKKAEFAGIDEKKKTTRCFCFSGPLGVADSAGA